jgi:hypothetical protein
LTTLGAAATVAAAKGLVGGSVNLGAALALGAHLPGAGVIVPAAVVSVVSYGASLVLYLLALRSLGASRVAALFAVAPHDHLHGSDALRDTATTRRRSDEAGGARRASQRMSSAFLATICRLGCFLR